MVHAFCDAQHVEDFSEAIVELEGPSGDVADDLDVLLGGEGGEQVVLLEDEADGALAEIVALGVGHVGEVASIDGDAAGGGRGEAAEDVEEGRLAGAGGADDGEELAAGDIHGDAVERIHVDFADGVGLEEVSDLDDGCVVHGRKKRLQGLVGEVCAGHSFFHFTAKFGFLGAGAFDDAPVGVGGAGGVDASRGLVDFERPGLLAQGEVTHS